MATICRQISGNLIAMIERQDVNVAGDFDVDVVVDANVVDDVDVPPALGERDCGSG